jgi:preprotein translocase subunit SecD
VRLLVVASVTGVIAASTVYVFHPARMLSIREQTSVERSIRARARLLGVVVTVDASARSIRLAVAGSAPRGTLAALTRPGRLELLDLEANLVHAGPSPRRPRVAKGRIAVRCGPPAAACPNLFALPTHALWYVMRDRPAVRTADVRTARADLDPTTGRPVVLVFLRPRGVGAFRTPTRTLALRGARRASPQHVAIVIDGILRSFPQIDYVHYPRGIDASSGLEIAGMGSLREARQLGGTLAGGELPMALRRSQ